MVRNTVLMLGLALPLLLAATLWTRRATLHPPDPSPWLWLRIVLENTFVFIVPLFWPLALVHWLAFVVLARRIRAPRLASVLATAAPLALLVHGTAMIGERANRFGTLDPAQLVIATLVLVAFGWIAGVAPDRGEDRSPGRVCTLAGAVFLGLALVWGVVGSPRLL